MKTCTKCGETKPFAEFHKQTSKKDGYRSQCKSCRKQYRQENREAIRERDRRYHQENKEAVNERKRYWWKKNKEVIAERRRQHYQQNKEVFAERTRRYRQQNKEAVAERNRRYLEERNAKQPGCVYQIVNSINGRVYVGETIRGELRWLEHCKSLRGNYHKNSKLQADFNEFGEDVFEWSIIQELPKDRKLLEREETNTIQRLLVEGKELYNIILN